MGLLCDRDIEHLSTYGWYDDDGLNQLVHPCEPCEKRPGKISYGVSSSGYDMRIGGQLQIFSKAEGRVVDPKSFDPRVSYTVTSDDFVDLPPHSFALASSIERFSIPRNITGIVLGKSTYARCGVVANFTPLEPGWKGHVTIELTNTGPNPVRIYVGEGIAQVLFLQAGVNYGALTAILRDIAEKVRFTDYVDRSIHSNDNFLQSVCETSYADKEGKYNNQGPEVVTPRVD